MDTANMRGLSMRREEAYQWTLLMLIGDLACWVLADHRKREINQIHSKVYVCNAK